MILFVQNVYVSGQKKLLLCWIAFRLLSFRNAHKTTWEEKEWFLIKTDGVHISRSPWQTHHSIYILHSHF